MITLLVAPQQLDSDRVDVDGSDYRHLFRARRLAVGDQLRLVDGHGRARWAEVGIVERRRASLTLEGPAPANEPAYRLQLLVAALRSERAAWLVEKATELGVHSIRFIATERTPRTYAAARLERLRRVAGAAVEQCHRSRLPEIGGVESRETWRARIRAHRAEDRFYLHTHVDNPTSEPPRGASGIFLIGPEGGWSPIEVAELDQLGCRGLFLGPRTLRVETAAIAAAARLIRDDHPVLD